MERQKGRNDPKKKTERKKLSKKEKQRVQEMKVAPCTVCNKNLYIQIRINYRLFFNLHLNVQYPPPILIQTMISKQGNDLG